MLHFVILLVVMLSYSFMYASFLPKRKVYFSITERQDSFSYPNFMCMMSKWWKNILMIKLAIFQLFILRIRLLIPLFSVFFQILSTEFYITNISPLHFSSLHQTIERVHWSYYTVFFPELTPCSTNCDSFLSVCGCYWWCDFVFTTAVHI